MEHVLNRNNNHCKKELKELRKRDEISLNEYNNLLNVAANKGKMDILYIMRVLAETGIRVGDLENVTVEAIKKGKIACNCKIKYDANVDKQLQQELLKYCEEKNIKNGIVFLNKQGNVLEKIYISTEIKKIAKEAGIKEKNIYLHSFRFMFKDHFYNRENRLKEKVMKRKIVLSTLFIISLIPMLFNQYGGLKGVQEISGLINLLNPIGIISVLLFIIGLWVPLKNKKINKTFEICGVFGIVVSEIYKFLTWHVLNITGEISIQNSIEFAFPEFYIGLIVSIIMIIAYFVIDKKVREQLALIIM